MNSTADFLTNAFLVQCLSILCIPFFTKYKKAFALFHLVLLSGLIAGLVASVSSLIDPSIRFLVPAIIHIPHIFFRFDPLGLFFLCIIQLIAVPITIYNYSYFTHYIEKGKSVKSAMTFYLFLLLSTQILVTANHSILFLICWELMSTSAYLCMIFEMEKKEVQIGSFYYLIISHVAMFLLFVFFILLHHHAGSWLFSDFRISTDSGALFFILYFLSLTAFGLKAGFMPFHFWLPQAHPIAPSVLSAFLSGVIIKMGIYGILRTFQFLNPVPAWLGWFFLCISLISAVFGVWYALAQHDIKKLLAYHSVENIGIIGIGISLGFIGNAYHSVAIQILGFGGALLHTLNHAIFKSLLFIGSGIVCQNLNTRNIEEMGGIVHQKKFLVLLFLIGSVAISGIPPLNGFVSEFIIFKGFFTTARELGNLYPLFMLIATVGLAFVGGLAVACFTKINSIMFLGSPRKEKKIFSVSMYDYTSLAILASLCIFIGVYPKPLITILSNIIFDGFIPTGYSSELMDIHWLLLSIIFASLLTGIILFYIIKKKIQNKYGRRISSAWGCGYDAVTPRMQYTASSFADELNGIAKTVLLYKKTITSENINKTRKETFSSHSDDFVDNRVILVSFSKIRGFFAKSDFLNFSDIRYYIAFILIIITFYSLLAFLWT